MTSPALRHAGLSASPGLSVSTAGAGRTDAGGADSLDVSRLEKVRHTGGKIIARCPACAEAGTDKGGDHLVIYADGKFGCIQNAGAAGVEHRKRIFELAGIVEPKPILSKPTRRKSGGKIHATLDEAAGAAAWSISEKKGKPYHEATRWAYHNAAGDVIAYQIRFESDDGALDESGKRDKTFMPVHAVTGGWKVGDPAGLWPLYGLPALLASDPAATVFIGEGEKKTDAAHSIGLCATASAHGANSPQKTDWQPLAGRDVCILSDNDTDGRKYGVEVARLCHVAGAKSVRLLELPGLPPKGDLVQFIEQRDDQTPDQIKAEVERLADAAPAWMPAATEPFESIRYMDLLNHTPDPSGYVLGDGFLRRGAGSILTGGTGLGKSVAVAQLATSVSAGVSFFGMQSHGPKRVLYLAAENDMDTLKRDVLSIVKHHPDGPCPLLVHQNLDIRHVYGLAGIGLSSWLETTVKATRPELVIFDPYQAFLNGATDINSTATFFSFIRPVEAITKAAGAALLLVLHTPKPRERENWTARESVYLAAGTSAVANWARTSCELTECGDSDGRFRLRFSKNAERTGLVDEDRQTIRDLYLEHSRSRKAPFWTLSNDQGKPMAGSYTRQILAYRDAHPEASQREIAKAVGCSPGTVNSTLKAIDEND